MAGDRFSDKVVLVTGASRGLGKSLAKGFAAEGASVVVVGRTESPEQSKMPGTIHETVREIEAAGGAALALRADVTREDEVNAMVSRVVEQLDRIDVLVNNAGILVAAPTQEISLKHSELMFRVNFFGPLHTSRAVASHMREQGRGNILNITAHAATNDLAPITVYGATKAALNRLTTGLASELKPFGVAVNALGPGLVETEGAQMLFPRGTPGRPDFAPMEVVHEPAFFLAEQTASTYTGQVVEVWEWQETWP